MKYLCVCLGCITLGVIGVIPAVAHGAPAAASSPAALARSLALHPSDVGKGYKVERPSMATRATIGQDVVLDGLNQAVLSQALKNGWQGSYFEVLSGARQAIQVYVAVLSNAGDAHWFYGQAITNVSGTRVPSPAIGAEHQAFQSHNSKGSSQETTILFRHGRFVAYVDLLGGTGTAGPTPARVLPYADIMDQRMRHTL